MGAKLTGAKLTTQHHQGCATDWQQETRSLVPVHSRKSGKRMQRRVTTGLANDDRVIESLTYEVRTATLKSVWEEYACTWHLRHSLRDKVRAPSWALRLC